MPRVEVQERAEEVDAVSRCKGGEDDSIGARHEHERLLADRVGRLEIDRLERLDRQEHGHHEQIAAVPRKVSHYHIISKWQMTH